MSSPFVRTRRQKCFVVTPPVDLRRDYGVLTPRALEELRRRFGIPAGRQVVLFVGRFVYYKGLEYLVDAMKYIDAHLLLVGSGPLEHQIRRRVKAYGLEHRVSFAGRLSDQDLYGCYELADVFVLPSIESAEAFGLVQVEAMAHGLPVVNTDLQTGVPWVSRHGDTGLTVPPRDPKALAEAVNTILMDKVLAERLSRNARDRARDFSLEKVVGQVFSIYEGVLQARPRWV
jgi:rhamnosyl/mannosyltransferase